MKNIVLVVIVVFYMVSCVENKSYKSERSSEKYMNYDTTGRINKYLDEDFKEVHYKSQAAYYRNAYYINGQISADSIAHDYYISGELKFEGHIQSETPNVFVGECIWYYKNGNIEFTKIYDENGAIHGESKEYYEDGKIKGIYHYDHGNCEGNATEYYENGKVKSSCSYVNNDKYGVYREYYQSGKIKLNANYVDGYYDGIVQSYYENGKQNEYRTYKEGCYNGVYRSYYENGNLKEYRIYKNNVCNGEYRSYYENGRLESKGMMRDGEKVGKWKYYDSDGVLTIKDYDKKNEVYAYSYSYGSLDPSYDELWDECDELHSVLEDAGIDHDCLSEDMSYDELLDLRDEYQSLIDEYGIEY